MRKTAQIVFVFLILFLINTNFTFAQSEYCDSSVYPSTYVSDNLNDHVISINNIGSTDIKWLQIISPDNEITMNSGSANGFSSDFGSGYFNLNGGTLPVGGSVDVNINSNFGSLSNGLSWGVNASFNEDGSGYFNCGSPLISQGNAPIVTENNITNVSIQAGVNSASIRYNTILSSTSTFEYGTTTSYGSSSGVNDGNISHNINLSGLSASTVYHYRIVAVSNEGTIVTGDNTFRTAEAGATTTITTTVTNTVTNTITNSSTVTKTLTLTDTTAPTVRFLDEFKKIYEEAPLVNIKTTDGSGIARLEYTIDGTNYLPIDIEDKFGSKTITTSFVPNIIEDGDYTLIVRATDTSGNKVNSKKVEFTIDRLPPRVGPLTVMAGPIVINGHGFAVGVEYKFILSSAGGPNKITMSCGGVEYDFQKNKDIGVWTTKIKFLEAGSCVTEITAIDGAGNIEVVKREELTVNKLGHLENGILTVYWYDDYEKKFVMWDSLPYGQTNPIDTRQMAGYSLLLPKGKYYLEAKSLGKRTSVSNIIDVDETVLINDDWELSPIWKFWQLKEEKIIKPEVLRTSEWQDVNFELPKAFIGEVSTLDIKGKNSVISLLASWHPTTNNVLKVMDELSKNKYSVYPTLIHENQTVANAVKRRSGYSLNIYSDPDGELITKQKVSELPVVWIVDRFGQVIKQKSGNIDYDEITNLLNSLN